MDVGLDNYRQAFLVDVNFLPAFVQTLSDLLIDLPIINLFALVMRAGLRATDLKQMVYAYPTSASDISYMV